MTRSRTLYQVDVFTREPFAGNPAGVVLDAEGLTDTQMQKIASELKNSETAFLFPPEGDDHDFVARFFTPTTEVPMCGHATLGANYARAVELGLSSVVARQKTKTGIIPVEVRKCDTGYKVAMVQHDIQISPPVDDLLVNEVMLSLGLAPSDLDDRCPVQVVSTGHSKLIVGLSSAAALDAIVPEFEKLAAIGREHKFAGYFVFTLDIPDADLLADCRMFAPQIGIAEDPVTGNGNAPLGVYLVHNGLVPHDGQQLEFTSRQGRAMGRPGTARVTVAIAEGKPLNVRVTADVVTAFKGVIEI